MDHREERAELRGAVYCGDAGSLVGILKREAWPENALQLIGDGLLRVLTRSARSTVLDGPGRLPLYAVKGVRSWHVDRSFSGGTDSRIVHARDQRPLRPGCSLSFAGRPPGQQQRHDRQRSECAYQPPLSTPLP